MESQPDIQLFRDVFNASPIGIVVENLEGQPLFANPALCSMLGFSEEEVRSKHCVQFSPPEDSQKDWALFQQLRAGSTDHYQLEKRYFRRDGSLVWGRLSLSLLNHRPSPLVIAMVEDITEQKRAEEARLRHAAIVESSEDAIASGTLDGIIVSWNTGAQHMYGYTEAEAVGKPITILVPPDLPDEENKILETLKAGGRIEHFETVRVTKTGKRINVSLSISPIKDSSGATVGVSGIARDITDRKRNEKRLREYERAIENAEEMIAVVDREYRYLIANRQFLKLRNKTQEQVTGHFVNEVLNEGVFETIVKPKLDECFQGKIVRYEMKYRYPELGERDILVSYFPIEGASGIDRAACILQDITERKRAEQALRESEETFRSVFRDAGVGMVIVSPEGRFLAANKAFCDCLGYTEEELLEKTVESVTLSEDWPAFSRKLREALTEGHGFQWFEKRCLHKGGRIVYTESSASLIRSREGHLQYFVGEVLDITNRKQAEEALTEMTRRLIEAQEQERTRIGRELHDDINQRLAMLAVELEELEHDPSEFPTRLQESRKRLIEISHDVQALSHDLHSSKLQYLGVVGGIKGWCREFGERQRIEIDFKSDVPSHLPLEIGLPLFRVVQEALNNAVKHSGAKRIEVQLWADSSEIHLIVSDFGKGFDTKAAMQGHGHGLISMRERVRLVNGTIAIDSKPMGGTSIHVRIPLKSEHNSEAQAG
jgi:PAS domain S-box-containing protein